MATSMAYWRVLLFSRNAQPVLHLSLHTHIHTASHTHHASSPSLSPPLQSNIDLNAYWRVLLLSCPVSP